MRLTCHHRHRQIPGTDDEIVAPQDAAAAAVVVVGAIMDYFEDYLGLSY